MRKTPKDRAEEALNAADARVVRYTKIRDRLKTQLVDAQTRLEEAEIRANFLAQDPALVNTTQTGTEA